MVGGTYALQRPEETSKVSKRVSKEEQEKTSSISSRIPQEACQKNKRKSQGLETGKPREIQKEQQETMATEKKKQIFTGASASKISKEPVRFMSETFHKEKPTRTRPLSQNGETKIATAQYVQLCNRAPSRFPRNVPTGGEVSTKVETLSGAIAKAEGFCLVGSLPNRYHNPGDLKAIAGYRYPGQIGIGKGGHVIFRNNAAGWNALEHQLDKIAAGNSRYNVNMTLKEIGKKYAGNWRVWSKNVSHNLGVDPNAQLWEILGIAPVLERVWTIQK